jgi:polygalacturonase
MINLYTLGDDNVPAQKRIFDTPTTGLSPSFINFINSKTIFIDSIHIINSPEWVIQPVYSTDITISNVKINTINGANTDGIVIDSSKNVLVENSSLATGDDAIVLKSGRDKDGQRVNRSTTNVVVRNNNIQEAHAAMAIGSEMSGGINNIWFFNNTINRAQYAIRIKSQLGRGGIVENIWAQNITARRIDFDAINIETSYGIPFSPSSTDEPTIRNIKIENITASRAKRAIFINGLKNTPIANIDLNNLKIQSSQKTVIENAVDIRIDHANII